MGNFGYRGDAIEDIFPSAHYEMWFCGRKKRILLLNIILYREFNKLLL